MLYAIVAVIALIFDQLLKYWTTVHIVENTGEAKLIPGLIHLAHIHNTGAAFSFLQGGRWFFVVLCVIFAAVIIYLLAKGVIRTPGARWAAVIVLAGAAGNAIDRAVSGYVVDMLEFEFISFPVFNLADIYITLGAIVFCIFLLTEKPGKSEAKQEKQPRRKKIEIPAFPKREPLPAPPPMDPEDPFAEWERKAAEPTIPAQEPAAGQVTYTRPVRAEVSEPPVAPEPPAAPLEPAAPTAEPEAPSKTEQVLRMIVSGRPQEEPAAPLSARPEPEPQPQPKPKPAATASEFDLDSILEEFKDL